MLSSSSSIQKRHIQHRRMNSTGAIFEAAQVRPLPANKQRAIGHRRGISLQGQPIFPGHNSRQMMPDTNQQQFHQQDPNSVSIDTNNRQHIQQIPMQVAQQHIQPQPGIQIMIPDTPQTFPEQANSGIESVQSAEKLEKRRRLMEKWKEYNELAKEIGEYDGMSLPTPTSTPHKLNFPMMQNMELSMAQTFPELQDFKLDTPTYDTRFGLASPGVATDNGYDSDAMSPTHTIHSSPQQKSIATYEQQASTFKANIARQLFSGTSLQPVQELRSDVIFAGQPEPQRRNSKIAIAGVVVDATIEDTGISAEFVQQFISPQNEQGRWVCLYTNCGKDFGRRENIRAHVQTHLGDRQYRCNHCNKCFVRQHDLKRHAKIHTGDKSHKCACGQGFARQDALTRHKQRGMCVGGYPNPDRKVVKRGRPRKNRPDHEERLEKASKTRKAIASASSSDSTGSPHSYGMPDDDFKLDESSYETLQSLESSTDPRSDDIFSLETLSISHPSPLSSTNTTDSFDCETAVSVMMSRSNTQQSTSTHQRTPSMSPSTSHTPHSVGSPEQGKLPFSSHDQIAGLTTPAGSPPSVWDHDSLFSSSLDFETMCGTGLEQSPMDAFIINGLDMIPQDTNMDFKDFGDMST